MAFNQLNIVIGARIENLQRQLGRVERDLQRFSRKMETIGTNLTQAISAPLAGIGVAAVSSFASLEKLQKTLESVMGSGSAAAVELEKLREVAKAPGLGFEQAVQASARLQAVGLSADSARETIKQFANAVARSGGGAEEFDGVTRALGQIAAKGKVYAEEINQINERIFEIRPALEAAFGTSNTEDLAKLGVSSEEFISKITAEFSKLERVNGGLSNSFENFRDSVKNSLARIGQEINRVFDVSGIFDRVSDALSNVALQFSLLDDGTKRSIVNFVAIAAAIGPAILLLSKLASGFSLVVVAAKSLIGGAVGAVNFFAGLPAIVARAGAAVSSFVTLVGGVAPALAIVGAAVGAAVLVYQSLQRRYELATAANRALQEVQSQAIQQTAQEVGQVRRLVDIAKDENRSKEDRAKALQRLQEIAPGYFGGLDIERVKTEQLVSASDSYAKSLIQRAKAQLAATKIAEIDAKLLDAQTLAQENQAGFLQTVGNLLSAAGSANSFISGQVSSYTKNLNENVGALKRQKSALEDFLKANSSVESANISAPNNPTFTRTPKQTGEQKEINELIKERGRLIGEAQKIEAGSGRIAAFENLDTQTKLFNSAIASLAAVPSVSLNFIPGDQITLSEKYLSNIQAITTQTSALNNATVGVSNAISQGFGDVTSERLAILREGIASLGLAFNQVTETAIPSLQAALQVGLSSFEQYARSGINNMKELGRAVLQATAGIVKSFIQQGVAAAVANALKNPAGIIPPVGLAIAAAAGTAAGGLFQGLLNRLRVPALASGGLASGPTLALVGEYPGARTNPEVIAPLDKLKNLIRSEGGNVGPIVAETIIRGQDLRVILQRADNGFTRQTSG